ncbi:MAG: hypothetical protein ACI9CA_001990 [Natronomonas sp.]|jgi:hypothetical protein
MHSVTPIGGSTALKRAASTRTDNTHAMGNTFGAECAFPFRTETWVRTGAPTHAHRRHHPPQATGYGRP